MFFVLSSNALKYYNGFLLAIDMSRNREWMYTKRITRDGHFNLEFTTYVLEFLEFVKTKPRGVFEVTEDENEADGFFQIDERFAVPHDSSKYKLCGSFDPVTRTDRVCLASNTNTYKEISDVDSEGFEDEQHEEDVEDEDDGDELVYSDHDSDYDEE